MKLSTAKRRINKTLDELTQSVIDDWYDHFKNGYIKGYTDAREGVAPMYADAIADTPQADEIGDCNICRFAGCSECDDCINGSEWVRETEWERSE